MGVATTTLPNGVGVIEVKGSVLSDDEIKGLRSAVADFVNRRWRRLLIDFSDATYINSTALGVLVAAQTSYAKREWQLKLSNMNKHIHVIFAITNLGKIFAVYDTREEAIKSFT